MKLNDDSGGCGVYGGAFKIRILKNTWNKSRAKQFKFFFIIINHKPIETNQRKINKEIMKFSHSDWERNCILVRNVAFWFLIQKERINYLQ